MTGFARLVELIERESGADPETVQASSAQGMLPQVPVAVLGVASLFEPAMRVEIEGVAVAR